MEASLADHKPEGLYQIESKELKVTLPLNRCLSELKEKYNMIASAHAERFEQVKSNFPFPHSGASTNPNRTCASTAVIFIAS